MIKLPTMDGSSGAATTDDGRPIIRATKLSLTDAQVDSLSQASLVVYGAQGTEIELPPALLAALGQQNTGLEVTLSDLPLDRAQAELPAGNQALSGQEISTNFSGRTYLRFPAPQGVQVADLKVHVKHSDGTEEDLVPRVVVAADGRTYLEISVERFSTFVIYQPETVELILTIGEKAATIAGRTYELDVAPYVQPGSDRTMVPIRFISEGLGATVEWLADSEQVRITDGVRTILLTINSNIAYVNDEAIALDAAPQVVQGRTFVPLRFISETLGAIVDYNATTETVTIRR